MVRVLLVLMVLTAVLGLGQAKVYGRCELAKRLRQLGASGSQLATWVCIAHRESGYNTAALNIANTDNSRDFGIFQINNRYWCDRGSRGCGVSCSAFHDDEVANDFRCAQQIYHETKRFDRKGDGFSAWVVYRQHCNNGRAANYLNGC